MDNTCGVGPIVILANLQHKKRFLVNPSHPLKHIHLLLQILALAPPPRVTHIVLHGHLRKQEPLPKLLAKRLQEQPPILRLVPLQISPLKLPQEPLVKPLQELHRILARELHPIQEPLRRPLHAHPLLVSHRFLAVESFIVQTLLQS